MKAISLWQPWASWIMWGWKTIETRTHSRFYCLQGQTIAIHAAQRFDNTALSLAFPYLTNERREKARALKRLDYPCGSIIGTAEVKLVSVCMEHDAGAALIQCRTHRCGLWLVNVTEFATPIPCKGKQGIFNVYL